MAEGLAPSGDSLVGHHLHYHGAPPAHSFLFLKVSFMSGVRCLRAPSKRSLFDSLSIIPFHVSDASPGGYAPPVYSSHLNDSWLLMRPSMLDEVVICEVGDPVLETGCDRRGIRVWMPPKR